MRTTTRSVLVLGMESSAAWMDLKSPLPSTATTISGLGRTTAKAAQLHNKPAMSKSSLFIVRFTVCHCETERQHVKASIRLTAKPAKYAKYERNHIYSPWSVPVLLLYSPFLLDSRTNVPY